MVDMYQLFRIRPAVAIVGPTSFPQSKGTHIESHNSVFSTLQTMEHFTEHAAFYIQKFQNFKKTTISISIQILEFYFFAFSRFYL